MNYIKLEIAEKDQIFSSIWVQGFFKNAMGDTLLFKCALLNQRNFNKRKIVRIEFFLLSKTGFAILELSLSNV